MFYPLEKHHQQRPGADEFCLILILPVGIF